MAHLLMHIEAIQLMIFMMVCLQYINFTSIKFSAFVKSAEISNISTIK